MLSAKGKRYEFKVEYDSDGNHKHFSKFFLREEEIKRFSSELLVKQLHEKCDISPTDLLRIKYMDSDKDWIDLRCDDFDSLVDMIETVETVSDREGVVRIVLKVSSDPSSKVPATHAISPQIKEISSKRFYSPSPDGKQNTSQKRFRSKLNLNEKFEDNSSPVLIDLGDDNQTWQSSVIVEDEPINNTEQYISPTQKYFDKVETDEKKLRETIEEKEQDLLELEESFREPEDFVKLPLCSYCHTSGHNKTNCLFTPCESASYCHDIKRHPDENKLLKELREELKTLKGKLHKIQDDINGKRQMLKGIQDTFLAKVQTDLINSNPKKYLRKSTTGHFIPNWLIINCDVRKLERICQGKVPPKHEITDLLKKYNERSDVREALSTENEKTASNHVNPVKSLWEKKGIAFPGHGLLPNSTVANRGDVGAVPRTPALDLSVPNSKREEEYLIQIALNKSLQYNQRPCEPGYYHERATSFTAEIQPTDAEEVLVA